MAPVEKKIIDLFGAGDVKAMELLYDHYADTLYGITFNMVKDEALAQDVLQEAFVKVWQHSSEYDPSKGRLFTWLVRIVRNKAIDAIRKTNRSGEIQSELKLVSSGTDAKESNVAEVEHDIEKVLSGLDKENRELIEHSYILGYSHPEIAEKFNMPLGTVKTRIRKAMQDLRSIFGNGR